jgi:hypothetical protein
MDTMMAYERAKASKGNESKVFDWIKAANLIKEKNPDSVGAGLSQDWEWTGGNIWNDGKPVHPDDTYTYLASIWAIPEIDIDGEIIDCYKMQSETPDWSAETYWPKEALAILGLKEIPQKEDNDGNQS